MGYAMTSVDMTRSTLSDAVRQDVGKILQSRLSDLLALSLNLKQAHWHVTGRTFKQVHEQLDEIVDDVRTWSDEVAERSTTLGVPTDGRPSAVVSSKVPEFPSGFLTADQTVTAVAEQIAAVVASTRAEIDRAGELDPVTQELLIGSTAGLEKHLWMLRAQLA